MASNKMMDALNEQLNKEMYSSYLYLSMSTYFEDQNLIGMATWMKTQSQEEYAHAMKFYDYILQIDGRVKLLKIDEPASEWDSPKAAFENALKHEKFITKSIHELVDLALEEKDHATHAFLNWFVNEQVEEEDTAKGIIDKFTLIGDNKSGMYMLDNELGSRPVSAE